MTDRLTKGDRVIIVNADDPNHNETGTIAIDDGSSLPYFIEFDAAARRGGEWYQKSDVAPAEYRPIAPGEHVPEGADVFIPAGLASRHGATGGMRGAVKTFSEIDEDGDLPVMVPTPPDGKQMMWFCATDCYINATAAQTKETGVRVPVSDEARAEAEPARPKVGDRVRIEAPSVRFHGRTGTVVQDDNSPILPFEVEIDTDAGHPTPRPWFSPAQVVVIDDEGEMSNAEETPESGQPIRVLRRHAIVLEQPVAPDDLARAARALEPGMRVAVHTYADRMEIVGTDPEDDRG